MSVRLLLAAVSMILLPGRAAAQGDRSLLMADSAWARAYATHDTTLALELFSPDLVVTNTAGELKDRTGGSGRRSAGARAEHALLPHR